MTINDIIRLEIDKSDIINAIQNAQRHQFIDNLRSRSPIVSFDSKVRGYLGETAIKKWLNAHGINNFQSNRLNEYSCDVDIDIITNNKSITCEIKTSKIPDKIGNLNTVISDCDIKIIKRYNDVVVDRDLYIQIYYNLLTRAHDEFLKNTYANTRIGVSANADTIYNAYRYYNYIDNVFFVAWDYKNHIERKICSLPTELQTYRISKREFYTCKIYNSFEPIRLIKFINIY